MPRMRTKGIVLVVLLAGAVVSALTFGTAKPAQAIPCLPGESTSSGCTFYDHYTYMRGGCRFEIGSTCYYCEYTCDDGSFDQCGENHDGSYQMCRKCDPTCEPLVDY